MRCLNPNCKDKFKPKWDFLQKFCMEKEECIKMAIEYKKEKLLCERVKEMKKDTHSKEYRKELQNEINKLARLIDASLGFKCIDCGKDYGKQTDGAHYHSRGANCSLRYNLHNIHSAKSDCNQFSDKHKEGYKIGIIGRYGTGYWQLILDLPLKYKEAKLSNAEVVEKLKLVRSINRNFNTYQISDGSSAREMFNQIIGIYA